MKIKSKLFLAVFVILTGCGSGGTQTPDANQQNDVVDSDATAKDSHEAETADSADMPGADTTEADAATPDAQSVDTAQDTVEPSDQQTMDIPVQESGVLSFFDEVGDDGESCDEDCVFFTSYAEEKTLSAVYQTSDGSPIAGAFVTFYLDGDLEAGSLSSVGGFTNAQGIASVSFTASNVPGQVVVNATVQADPGVAPISFIIEVSGPQGLTSCEDVVGCIIDDCLSGETLDPSCFGACLAKAEGDAVAPAQALIACTQEECVQTVCVGPALNSSMCIRTCAADACIPQSLECVGAEPLGTQPCYVGMDCLDSCSIFSEAGVACTSDCVAILGEQAFAQLSDFSSCFAAAENASDPFSTECQAEFITCLTGGQQGSQSCLTGVNCISACMGGGSPSQLGCIGACLSEATSEAQGEIITVMNCSGGQEASPGQLCLEHVISCASPSGTQDCAEIATCQEACEEQQAPGTADDLGCLLNCLNAGSQDGAQDLIDMMTCPPSCEAQCGIDDFTCLNDCFETQCAPLFAKCTPPSGPPLPPGF